MQVALSVAPKRTLTLRSFRGKKLKLIGRGNRRNVYEIKGTNLVLKVPRDIFGINSNKEEAEFWKTARGDRRAAVLPCRLLSSGYLLMMRASDLLQEQVPNGSGVRWVENYSDEECAAFKSLPTLDEGRRDGYQMGLYKGKYRYFDYEAEVA